MLSGSSKTVRKSSIKESKKVTYDRSIIRFDIAISLIELLRRSEYSQEKQKCITEETNNAQSNEKGTLPTLHNKETKTNIR